MCELWLGRRFSFCRLCHGQIFTGIAGVLVVAVTSELSTSKVGEESAYDVTSEEVVKTEEWKQGWMAPASIPNLRKGRCIDTEAFGSHTNVLQVL